MASNETTIKVILIIAGLFVGSAASYAMLNPKIAEISGEVNVLQNELTASNNETERLQNELSEKNEEIQIINNEIDALADEIDVVNNELDVLNNEVSNSLSQIIEKDSEIASLENQISELESSGSNNSLQIIALEAIISEMEKQLPEYRKGEWNVLKTYSGESGKTTNYLYIPQNEIRIKYSITESDYLPYIIFDMYRQGFTYREWSSGIVEQSSMTTYIHNIPVDFYYFVITPSSGVETWTFNVEIWVPE